MPRAAGAGRTLRTVAPVLAVLAIVALDRITGARAWPIPVVGLLDEPAHLLTARLALGVAPNGLKRVWPWVFLGAVAIDLDHVPVYLWGGPVAVAGGRPVTHSPITIVLLVAVAAAVPRVRTAAGALAAGVLFHFLRDVATGPGLPLWWPLRPESVLGTVCWIMEARSVGRRG